MRVIERFPGNYDIPVTDYGAMLRIVAADRLGPSTLAPPKVAGKDENRHRCR